MNITTKKLIEELMNNHTEYNQNVENYDENGEEEFTIWLDNEIKKFIKTMRHKTWKNIMFGLLLN